MMDIPVMNSPFFTIAIYEIDEKSNKYGLA
jgi:hypothetical protein